MASPEIKFWWWGACVLTKIFRPEGSVVYSTAASRDLLRLRWVRVRLAAAVACSNRSPGTAGATAAEGSLARKGAARSSMGQQHRWPERSGLASATTTPLG